MSESQKFSNITLSYSESKTGFGSNVWFYYGMLMGIWYMSESEKSNIIVDYIRIYKGILGYNI